MGAPGDAPYRDHLEMVRLAQAAGLGVFGIRPFAAGSLTAAIDRTLPPEHPEDAAIRAKISLPGRGNCDDQITPLARNSARCVALIPSR